MRMVDVWAGREDVGEVADMIAHVPRGSAIGEWIGGHLAITAEVEAAWETSYILAAVNSKKKTKPRPMPEGVRAVKAKGDRAVAMAEKYRQKHRG